MIKKWEMFCHNTQRVYTNMKLREDRYDYLATKTHAIIVPSCGIDSVPADASVHLASKTLGHAPLGDSMSSAGLSGGVPGGTIASFFTALEDVPLNLLRSAASDWALSPVLGAPSPATRLVYRIGRYARVGSIAIFGSVNRALVQRTAGLLELARRDDDDDDDDARSGRGSGGGGARIIPVYYGPAFTYTEFMPTANAVNAFLLSLALGVTFFTLAFIAPVRLLYFSSSPLPPPLPAPPLLHETVGSILIWFFFFL